VFEQMQAWCVLDNQHFNACKTATNNASGLAVLQISGLSKGMKCSAALSENDGPPAGSRMF
jgi:hypothetical protein